MRFKILILTLVAASLACTANISVLKPTATSFPQPHPSSISVPTQTLPTSSLDSRPVIIPDEISVFYMLNTQDGWIITNTSVLGTADGGATWHVITPSGVATLGSGTGNSFPDSNSVIRFQFVDTQTGWVVLSDANSHTSLYKTTDGGQTWAAQIQ